MTTKTEMHGKYNKIKISGVLFQSAYAWLNLPAWDLVALLLLKEYNYCMSKSYKSWAIYSVGIFIVWAIVLLIRWRLKSAPDIKDIWLIFAGFFIGWFSATIKFVLISKKIYGPIPSKSEK